jgi:hypothetical protein
MIDLADEDGGVDLSDCVCVWRWIRYYVRKDGQRWMSIGVCNTFCLSFPFFKASTLYRLGLKESSSRGL